VASSPPVGAIVSSYFPAGTAIVFAPPGAAQSLPVTGLPLLTVMIASRSEQTPAPVAVSVFVFTVIVVARATAGTPANASAKVAAIHRVLAPLSSIDDRAVERHGQQRGPAPAPRGAAARSPSLPSGPA